jgi:hypothetical protein
MCLSYKKRITGFYPLYIFCLMLFSQAAQSTPLPPSHPAEPVAVERQIPLIFNKYTNVRLQSVVMSWNSLGSVNFEPAYNGDRFQLLSSNSGSLVNTGILSWRVSATGTQVFDNTTGQTARIAELTSADVRAKEIVFSERLGVVWLYGKSVYRYHIKPRELERLQAADEALQAIRKLVISPSGLWFVSNGGIFQLDEAGILLNKVSQSGLDEASIVNAVVSDKEVWFITSAAKLMRLHNITLQRADISLSSAINAGVPAEFISMNQTLWVLLGNQHGEYYKLAYVDKDADKANVITGKYFSLSKQDGQLMASAYATSYRIDPAGKTITKLDLSIPGTLERAENRESVLFIGSSYAYKDNCEIVEHGAIDISKGWIQALLKSTLLFR